MIFNYLGTEIDIALPTSQSEANQRIDYLTVVHAALTEELKDLPPNSPLRRAKGKACMETAIELQYLKRWRKNANIQLQVMLSRTDVVNGEELRTEQGLIKHLYLLLCETFGKYQVRVEQESKEAVILSAAQGWLRETLSMQLPGIELVQDLIDEVADKTAKLEAEKRARAAEVERRRAAFHQQRGVTVPKKAKTPSGSIVSVHPTAANPDPIAPKSFAPKAMAPASFASKSMESKSMTSKPVESKPVESKPPVASKPVESEPVVVEVIAPSRPEPGLEATRLEEAEPAETIATRRHQSRTATPPSGAITPDTIAKARAAMAEAMNGLNDTNGKVKVTKAKSSSKASVAKAESGKGTVTSDAIERAKAAMTAVMNGQDSPEPKATAKKATKASIKTPIETPKALADDRDSTQLEIPLSLKAKRVTPTRPKAPTPPVEPAQSDVDETEMAMQLISNFKREQKKQRT